MNVVVAASCVFLIVMHKSDGMQANDIFKGMVCEAANLWLMKEVIPKWCKRVDHVRS